MTWLSRLDTYELAFEMPRSARIRGLFGPKVDVGQLDDDLQSRLGELVDEQRGVEVPELEALRVRLGQNQVLLSVSAHHLIMQVPGFVIILVGPLLWHQLLRDIENWVLEPHPER